MIEQDIENLHRKSQSQKNSGFDKMIEFLSEMDDIYIKRYK